jgi:hypothetical protein
MIPQEYLNEMEKKKVRVDFFWRSYDSATQERE